MTGSPNYHYGDSVIVVNSLTVEVAEALGGPEWLVRRRVEAAQRALAKSMPDTHEEVWRYSRVAELDLDGYQPVGRSTGSSPSLPSSPTAASGADAVIASMGDISGVVVVVDGVIIRAELAPEMVGSGVRFGPVTDDGRDEAALGAVLDEPTDLFAELNDAFCTDPVLLDVPDGLVVERPFLLVDWVSSEGIVTFPRFVLRAGDGSELDVVEWHGSDDVASLACHVTELDVGAGSRLGYANVQLRSERFWQIASHVSRVDSDGVLLDAQVALGGDYARTRTDCHLIGRGARGDLIAAYFARGEQMLDFRTFQRHVAPNTTSDLLFEGALDGQSRSVYTGLIKVEKQATGVDAFQTNHNIKLSDGTWTESVPNLEIDNNEVRCSHASTVGPVDEEQLFYLESRGVPPRIAERLIVSGFFDGVLSRLPAAGVASLAKAEIDSRLDEGGLGPYGEEVSR